MLLGLTEVALDLGNTTAVSAFATGAEFASFLEGASDAVLINNCRHCGADCASWASGCGQDCAVLCGECHGGLDPERCVCGGD